MMAFSAVFQWVPGDEAGLNRFLIEHYVEHVNFYKALLDQGFVSVNLPIQRLDNWPDWLAAHQQMSQSVWTGLGGGQSTDFGSLKYTDDNAVLDWQNYHQLWHKSVRDTLGL